MNNLILALAAFFSVNSAFADKLILLENADESLKTRVELIAHAKKSIDVQYFTIEHDYISISGLALLRKAAQNGVKIRILVDSMHNLMSPETMAAFMNHLNLDAERNIEIREFNPFNIFKPLCYTRRMHDKSLIIDGQYLIVGDRNVASGYYGIPEKENGKSLPTFQGMDLLVAGSKTVKKATDYFEARWTSRDVKPVSLFEFSRQNLEQTFCSMAIKGEGISGECERRQATAKGLVQSEIARLDNYYEQAFKKNYSEVLERPVLKALASAYQTDDIHFLHDDPLQPICAGKNPNQNIAKSLYETILQNTQTELIILTPYLVVTPEIENVIKKLVLERNVTVSFLTNSVLANDIPSASAAYLATRNKLMAIRNEQTGQRVRIYEFYNISSPFLLDSTGNKIRAAKVLDTVHAKVALMDNKMLFVGSSNWDFRSQNLNSEVGVVFSLKDVDAYGVKLEARNRIAELLKTSKLVSKDGLTNSEIKIRTVLTPEEQNAINLVEVERTRSVKLWAQLLSLPFVGDLLLHQQ